MAVMIRAVFCTRSAALCALLLALAALLASCQSPTESCPSGIYSCECNDGTISHACGSGGGCADHEGQRNNCCSSTYSNPRLPLRVGESERWRIG